MAEQRGDAGDGFGRGAQAVGLEMRIHVPEVEHHPVGQHRQGLGLPDVQVVAPVCNRTPEHFTPHGRRGRSSQHVRPDHVVGLASVARLREGNRRRLADVAHVDPRGADGADGLRVDAVLQEHVLVPEVVLEEVVGPQDGVRKPGRLHRRLDADLGTEVRQPRRAIGCMHRHVDQVLHAGATHGGDRQQRLLRLRLAHRVEQEHPVHVGEHALQRGDIEQVARHGGRPLGQPRLPGVARQHAHLGAACQQLRDHL